MEKYNAAARLQWCVLRYMPKSIDWVEIVDTYKERQACTTQSR